MLSMIFYANSSLEPVYDLFFQVNLFIVFVSYAEELGLDIDQFSADIASDEVAALVDAGIAEGNQRQVSSTPTFFVNGEIVRLPNSVPDMKAFFDTMKDGDVLPLPEDAWTKGDSEPKVIVEEFSDMECPGCGAYAPTLKQFFDEYPDDEVALVYKHFPLVSIHPFAIPAAKAAEAAGKQGKFWEMHDLIFENQREWSR